VSDGYRMATNLAVNGCVCDTVTAAGCADVTPPRHTWMRRTGDVVEVGCPTTGKRWTLTCVGGQWDGKMGKTCPGVPGVSLPGDVVDAQSSSEESESFLSSFPFSESSRIYD